MAKFNAWLASVCGLNFIFESSDRYKFCASINWRNKINIQALVIFSDFPPGQTFRMVKQENGRKTWNDCCIFCVSVEEGSTRFPLLLFDPASAFTLPPLWPASSCSSFMHRFLIFANLSKRYWDISPTSLFPVGFFSVELHFWKVYMKTTIMIFKCTEKWLWYTEYL